MMMDLVPTPSQTVGPFFHFGLTSEKHCRSQIFGPQAKGEKIRLQCRVLDGEGSPVNDAMIEIWQADADGNYAVGDQVTQSWDGFGRLATGEDGCCKFETIRPGRVAGPNGAIQAPHLEVAIFARGLLKQLFTRIYFAEEPANQGDPVLALVPEARRPTLLAHPDPSQPGSWQFDVHLQGEPETVFFDI